MLTDESDHDFSSFVVPSEYFPGIDLISKVILTDERIIDIITKTFVKAPKGSYVNEPIEFIHKSVCNVLYIPHDLTDSLPPIVINTTETFDDTKFNQIIRQCTNIFEMYNTLPICIIIAVQQLDKGIIELSSQLPELPFLREIPCAFWARQCILVSSKDSKLDKSKIGQHPLLDIIIAITSNDKVLLPNDGL